MPKAIQTLINWKLKILPNGEDKDSKDHLGLWILDPWLDRNIL